MAMRRTEHRAKSKQLGLGWFRVQASGTLTSMKRAEEPCEEQLTDQQRCPFRLDTQWDKQRLEDQNTT